MHGVIIIQGFVYKFRDFETNKYYRVSGVYLSDGSLSNQINLKHGQEVEAVKLIDGTVNIKFSPI
jgi:hypothetical protein